MTIAALCVLVSTAAWAQLNRPLAPLYLPGTGGAKVALRDPDASLTVINFWASWCKPCLDEIPVLVQLHNQWRGWGVRFVGIAVDSGSMQAVAAFAKQYAMTYPVVVATPHWAQRHFQVASLPVTLVIDGHGIIRKRLDGVQTRQRLIYLIKKYRRRW